MSFAWMCVTILPLICYASATESCGCTASLSGAKQIDGSPILAPLSGRQKVFEEAARQTQGMPQIRVAGGSIKYGTITPVIEADREDIDATETTNAEFAMFVKATNYTTSAEKYGWSFVFHTLLPKELVESEETLRVESAPWHIQVHGARWDAPEGEGSDILNRMQHPVVHVSYIDAKAYCQWAGKRPPTEAEWEHAAHGERNPDEVYPWGNDVTPSGKHMCNIWQGTFPAVNTAEDGYEFVAPATSFPPNDIGLYNMAGNVWEWVITRRDNHRILKGGSFLCHHSYCFRYRIAARSSAEADSSASHIGLRCARDV